MAIDICCDDCGARIEGDDKVYCEGCVNDTVCLSCGDTNISDVYCKDCVNDIRKARKEEVEQPAKKAINYINNIDILEEALKVDLETWLEKDYSGWFVYKSLPCSECEQYHKVSLDNSVFPALRIAIAEYTIQGLMCDWSDCVQTDG